MSGNGSPFWTFSLAVYANAEVQKECLDLQDRCGLDVNLLLFCVFIGACHGAQLPKHAIAEAAELVSTWHDRIVTNLRETRRALKAFPAGALPPGSSLARLRDDVKAIELEAERFEQLMLESWAESRRAQWPHIQPREAIAENIRTLFAICCEPPAIPALPGHLAEAALHVALASQTQRK